MGVISANPIGEAGGPRRAAFDAAFQGAAGAFSESAAIALLGVGVSTLPCPRFEDVFDAVASGKVACGIVPVENTLAGTVHPVIDLLVARDLSIVGETVLRISHALIGTTEATLDGVRRVLSHPVALQQCTSFFAGRPDVEAVPVFDTAGAVDMVMRSGDPADAAIAGAHSAAVYGARVLATGLEDDAANFTRFVRVVPRFAEPIPADAAGTVKTTLVFTVANRPGALLDCLRPFADRGIDLAKLESRPLRGSPFEYAFLVDLVGDTTDTDVGAALAELAVLTRTVRVLGSYESDSAGVTRDAAG